MTTTTPAHTDPLSKNLLRLTAVLWVVWGLVHVLAGVMTISQDTSAAASGIADAVDPAQLEMAYHAAVGAIINQHGFNLLWIGAFTTVCAVFVWQRKALAIWLAALIAGITDIGYFIFIDLGGYANFIPGTVMTIICASAVLLSAWVGLRLKMLRKSNPQQPLNLA
ncbi:MAG: hypothetical protein KTR15_16230 [Phycisphaeraceae bacterium]|nr:hypothetical protein [Phycisphaeraceae bacterium]